MTHLIKGDAMKGTPRQEDVAGLLVLERSRAGERHWEGPALISLIE